MATLIFIPNPFYPNEREISEIETCQSAYSLISSLNYDMDLYDPVIVCNQEIMECDFTIQSDDIVVFALSPAGGGGGGKTVLRIVMMVAVAVASAYTGGAVGAAYGAGYGAVAGAAVSIAGAMIINAVLPMQQPSLGSINNTASSPTYGWDAGANCITEGFSIPVIYGTVRVTPPLIGKYIETSGNNQYLHLLYAVSEGTVDSIAGVYINGDPIGDFTNVMYETRMGDINQTCITDFMATRADKSVGRILDAISWVQTQTTGNIVTGLTVGLLFPRGLYYAADDGSLANYSVQVQLQYSPDNVNWFTFADAKTGTQTGWIGRSGAVYPMSVSINNSGNGSYVSKASGALIDIDYVTPTYGSSSAYATITNNSSQAVRQNYSISGLVAGQYYLRAKFNTAPNSGTRYASECYFDYLEELIPESFTYPGTALLSIRALATNQLSGGMPQVTCLVTKNITNPADVVTDILTNTRYGYGVDPSRLLSSDFSSWKSYCTANNLNVNVYLDQAISVRKAIDTVSQIGYASIVQFGSRFGVIVDRDGITPVQGFLFTHGNIVKDSFTVEYLPIADRANIIDVSYTDASLNYKKTAIQVMSGTYDITNNANKASIDLMACTNRQQALNYAQRLINCNRYITITTSWHTSIDAIQCRVGDIVKVAHAQLVSGSISGRIVSATSTTITLDIPVPIQTNGAIEIRNIDDDSLITANVSSVSSDGLTLTLSTPLSVIPSPLSVYTYGQANLISRLMRISKIGTGISGERSITAIEYNSSVYTIGGTPSIPATQQFYINGLTATDHIEYAPDGSITTMIDLSWRGNMLFYYVWVRNGNQWELIGTTRTSNFSLNAVDGKQYTIAVGVTLQNASQIIYTPIGKDKPPLDVASLLATATDAGVILSWPASPDIDISGYILSRDGNIISDAKALKFMDTSFSLGDNVYSIVAIDTTYHTSVNPKTTTVTVTKPSTVLGITSKFSSDSSGMAMFILTWTTPSSMFSIDHYEITYNGVITKIQATTLSIQANWIGDMTFSIIAIDKYGFSSVPTSYTVTKVVPSAPANFRAQVIDNNVLFYWDAATNTSLPVTSYELRRGATWATATLIGKKSGGFTTVFEQTGGTYTYWIAAVDADNRYSSPVSLQTIVSNPPDFVSNGSLSSIFNGTLSSAVLSNGAVTLPIDTTTSFQAHFTSKGWATPNDQVNAGFPIFIEPATTGGYYEEVFDFNSVVGSTMVNIAYSGISAVGTPSIILAVSLSTDGTTYTSYGNLTQVYGIGFRYVKVRLTVSGDTKSIYTLSQLSVTLAAKLKNDAGSLTANAGDTSGTWVPFNIVFTSIQSIIPASNGSTPLTAVYTYNPATPTGFYVFVYNQSGTRVTGTVSWSAKGY